MDPELASFVTEHVDELNRRFDDVYHRFDVIDQRFDVVDQRFETVDRRFEAMDRKIDEEFEQAKRESGVVAEGLRRHAQILYAGLDRPVKRLERRRRGGAGR